MTKFSKISIIMLIILFLLGVTVCATDINMNVTPDNTQAATGNETDTGNQTTDTPTQNTADTTISSSDDIGGSVAPSDVSSIAQENMSFSNILNILIITVGVILILLAIAILIRLKN